MNRYLLDTTVLIDLSRGIRIVRPRLDAIVAGGGELGVCAINVAEFIVGVPAEELHRWSTWLGRFHHWHISREAAIRAGVYRRAASAGGRTIHLPDALVAGVASTLDATILTDNVKDFPMADLRVLPIRPNAAG